MNAIDSRLSLSQAIKINKENRGSLNYNINGFIQATLKDKNTNEINQQIAQHNAVTNLVGLIPLFYDWQLASLSICISNSPYDYNPLETYRIGTIAGGNSYYPYTKSVDFTNKIWTFQYSFPAPSANRTIRWIGIIGDTQVYTSAPYYVNPKMIFSGTKLSVPFTQTTAQILEVIYRWTITR